MNSFISRSTVTIQTDYQFKSFNDIKPQSDNKSNTNDIHICKAKATTFIIAINNDIHNNNECPINLNSL